MTHSAGSLQYNLFGEAPDRVVSGKSIRIARLERGLSVRALAKLAGCDAMTVLRAETGDQSSDAITMQRISRALGLDDGVVELARECIEPGTKAHLRDIEPWVRDEGAQYAVRAHPDGLTGDQVAELLELSPSSVDSAQESAFAKLHELAQQSGPEGDDVRDWITNVLEAGVMRRARESVSDWMGEDVSDG